VILFEGVPFSAGIFLEDWDRFEMTP